MFKKAPYLILFIFISSLVFNSCGQKNNGIRKVNNPSPKFKDEKVDLEKMYTMDVTHISLFDKKGYGNIGSVIDFDKNNNMYILNKYECTISVFNEKGEFVRSFGRKGDGPKEFMRPHALIIKKDKIYVFQEIWGYKTVTLEGKYISTGMVHIQNPLRYETLGDDFYIFRGETDRTISKLKFKLVRIEDNGFSKIKEIFSQKYPLGLDSPIYNFNWGNWIHISDNGEFYFPEDNLHKFSIVKYSKEGEPKLVFNRKYTKREYSKEAEERFYSIYEKGEREFPDYPPVVRKMFQDHKKNIWVVSGETYEDNENPDFKNTVDIFNERGEWLYSFKSKKISRYCLYNNGMIYRVLPLTPDTYEQHIEAYKIKY